MLLGVKFSPVMKDKDRHMLEFLEEKGVRVAGVELQLFPETPREAVEKTLDELRGYGLRFVGIHPPFPSFREEVEQWKELRADYFVQHAGSRHGYMQLSEELGGKRVFAENIFPEGDVARLCSLIEVGLAADNLLVDMAHLLFVHGRGLYWMSPWEQVGHVAKKIRAVHAADGIDGKGVVPQGGGTQGFRQLLRALFRHVPDAYYVGEPYGGHLHNNKGHIENALALWKLWQDFKDGEL